MPNIATYENGSLTLTNEEIERPKGDSIKSFNREDYGGSLNYGTTPTQFILLFDVVDGEHILKYVVSFSKRTSYKYTSKVLNEVLNAYNEVRADVEEVEEVETVSVVQEDEVGEITIQMIHRIKGDKQTWEVVAFDNDGKKITLFYPSNSQELAQEVYDEKVGNVEADVAHKEEAVKDAEDALKRQEEYNKQVEEGKVAQAESERIQAEADAIKAGQENMRKAGRISQAPIESWNWYLDNINDELCPFEEMSFDGEWELLDDGKTVKFDESDGFGSVYLKIKNEYHVEIRGNGEKFILQGGESVEYITSEELTEIELSIVHITWGRTITGLEYQEGSGHEEEARELQPMGGESESEKKGEKTSFAGLAWVLGFVVVVGIIILNSGGSNDGGE